MNLNEPHQHKSIRNFSAKKNLFKLCILAQKMRLFAPISKLRWLLMMSCLPLFGIYAAFGIAPQTIISPLHSVNVVEEATIPAIPFSETTTKPAAFWYREYVRRDDTLTQILSRLNIRDPQVARYIQIDTIANEIATSMKPGHVFETKTSADGNLLELHYTFNMDQVISIIAYKDGFQSQKSQIHLERRQILKSAIIKNSLFGATDKANIPDSIAMQVVNILENDIDFHEDLRLGDQLNVIYEGQYESGELISTGDVLAVEFVNNHKTYRAIGFRNEENLMQYFTPEGKSLQKSFLRSPLEFTRITSGFSLARFHPVLQRMRAHKGVDMAAPIGTGIRASGDATVDFVGVKGGYGNVIVLKHQGGISTVYGHLSSFAHGLSHGDKISQGQIIGYVGMTGLATGPHLHYEFLLNGDQRDPMKIALPKANSIEAKNLKLFNELSVPLNAKLNLLANTNIAALE